MTLAPFTLTALDRQLLLATQAGLPLSPTPFHDVAARVGHPVEEVQARFRALLDAGVIRRIAAVPDLHRVGVTANGMTVWDVDDARVDDAGARLGALPYVSHCYRRPRAPGAWPYNLFAMVHAPTRDEVEARVAEMATLLGDAVRARDVLYSRRVLKKTGARLQGG